MKQKTGNIKIADIEARREHSFSLQLDPKGKLHIKINLYKPMDSEGRYSTNGPMTKVRLSHDW